MKFGLSPLFKWIRAENCGKMVKNIRRKTEKESQEKTGNEFEKYR